MPSKVEIEQELEAIKAKHISPGKWVRFESAPSARGGRVVTREGRVVSIDAATDEPGKAPMVFYSAPDKDGNEHEFKNRPSKLTVIKAPHHH